MLHGSGRELKCVAVFNPYLIIFFYGRAVALLHKVLELSFLHQFNFSLVLHLYSEPRRSSCRILNCKRVKVVECKGAIPGPLSSEYNERRLHVS